MAMKVDDILSRVGTIEEERSDYTKAAEVWEDMWMLNYFKDGSKK